MNMARAQPKGALETLKQLDQYYEEVKDKNISEIEWGGFEGYKADFSNL